MSAIKENIKVLDNGFVRLVSTMEGAGDQEIVQAARVSYGEGTRTKRDDEKLIHYLMKNGHSSPFEMGELKFHLKMPLFVARQWQRHRTASINEISGRYSIIAEEYYIPRPENVCAQSNSNKQGRGEVIAEPYNKNFIDKVKNISDQAHSLYREQVMYDNKISRELARIFLPLNTYTEFYWKLNLWNLFRFLKQRLDEHAQFEIREYARVLFDITKEIYPFSADAFQKYVVEGD